jgi:S1-C subfamily serine protease
MRLIAKLVAVLTLAAAAAASAEDFRLVRSLSGPSGKVDGSRFVFDDVRSRFVYPQDKSFIVYFEWEGPLGTHVLTGLWRRPDGRVDSISPEVKIESKTKDLSCYWTYELAPNMMAGVWALEVRIDGQPSGAHSFEIAGTNPSPSPAPEPAPKLPTLDQIFRASLPSLVWVRKFDATGKRIDTASGFILSKDRVVTALQAVDGASKLEIEFAGGRKEETDEISAWSRSGDWAVVAVITGNLPALPLGDPKLVTVGERLIAFNVEGGARAIGGVDISGKQNVQGFGERIQLTPSLSSEAAGGPLLDPRGRVVAILGGSVMPGTRFDARHMGVSPALRMSVDMVNAATPVSGIPEKAPEEASKLGELAATGALTAPLSEMEGLIYVTTALEMSKSAGDPLPREVYEFSRRDGLVWVISEWQKKGKVSKGMLAAKVYDDQNRVRVAAAPKKTSLPSSPMRSSFSFALGPLSPGIYRIDLIWDDEPVWRTFIRVTD